MRYLSAVLALLLLSSLTLSIAPRAEEEAPGRGIASRGALYHMEYLRTRPGRDADYDRFVETVFRPMLEEMVRRGVWVQYNFMTVPYAGAAPCADYTHIFMAKLRNFAALDTERSTWAEVQRKFYPDERKRRQLFEEQLPQMREMIREEFLQDFEWK